MQDADPLTAKLAGAMLLLMKGSQNEVMGITARFDLSLSQLRMLFLLEHSDHDLAVNEIAELVGLSMPATGRAIEGLVRSGLALRREDELDRRVKRITLSDAGRDATARIADARIGAVQTLVDALDADELEQLDGAATTLNAILANHLPSHPQYCGGQPVATPAGASTRNEQDA